MPVPALVPALVLPARPVSCAARVTAPACTAADAFVAAARSAARSAAATAATMGKVAAGAALNTAAASKCPCSAPPWTLKAQTECHRGPQTNGPAAQAPIGETDAGAAPGPFGRPPRSIAPAGWLGPAALWAARGRGRRGAGAQGHSWHLPCPTCPCGSRRSSLPPVPLGHYLRPSERHPPEEAPEISCNILRRSFDRFGPPPVGCVGPRVSVGPRC